MFASRITSSLKNTYNALADNFTKIQSRRALSSDEPTKQSLQLTEEQPPIPPNYGWPGDENIESLFEMERIRDSFKYGTPPRMKRKAFKGPQVIRLMPITHCSNRRFYRLALTHNNCDLDDGFIEDLGSIDPMPNKENQILVALNVERIKYHLSRSVSIKGSVGPILGLAGLLPVHPQSYLSAFRNKRALGQINTDIIKNVE